MKNSNIENNLIKIGICPICGKGEMVKGPVGYLCNYFRSMNDKCSFNIYKNYFDKEITENIATDLILKKRTEVFTDFRKKTGETFSGYLEIEETVVKVKFVNDILPESCPVCNAEIEIFQSGYGCKNYHKKDDNGNRICEVFIPSIFCERPITPEIAITLLQKKKTGVLEGFISKDKTPFISRLYLDLTDPAFMIKFDNILCKCPKCGGDLFIGKKAFNCSNYRDEKNKCNFVIWREISGRNITPQEAIILCEQGETSILDGFKGKENVEYSKKMILTNDYTVKLI